jgi:uncharacterized protein (TIGR02145 family)
MLLEIVKQIVTKNGEQILFDSKRIHAFFLDLAKDEPKPIKRAFIDCLGHGVVKILKDVAEEERGNCKETLAQRLYEEEGGDVRLYRQAMDILCEVLFGCIPSSTATIVNIPKNTTTVLTTNQSDGSYFKDPRDGNVYRTVKIGNQVWMAENLNYKINNSWCYDNDEANGKKYGRLYTWDSAKIAYPPGWHLPTSQEWDELQATVGGSPGKKLKTKSGWNNYKGQNGNGTDDYGFSALPGGSCDGDGGHHGDFPDIGDVGNWWTATEKTKTSAEKALGLGAVYIRRMLYCANYVQDSHIFTGSFGFSVRYVKDGCGMR